MDIRYNEQNRIANYKNIAFIFITIFILIVRKSDSLANPQLWAEDGVIFFAQQYEYGAAAIFTPYAGYLHIVPRIIAALANAFFSYANIPTVYNYTSLFITIIVVAHCFSPRLQLPLKPLLAFSMVLVPQALNEVFLNITNLQWILCILLVLVLLKDAPNSKYGNYALQICTDFCIILFAGLTGPFMIIMFPFFAWKYFNIKKIYGKILLMMAFCTASIQLFYIVSSTAFVQEGSMLNLDIFISVFGRKMFGGLFFGKSLIYSDAFFVCFSSLIFFTILLFLSYKKSPTDRYITKMVFMILSISVGILGTVIMKCSLDTPIFIASRYFYVPYVLIAWSLILCLNQDGIWKNIFVIVSLLLIPISTVSIGIQTKMIDYNWKYYSSLIGTKTIVDIPINPHWSITLHNKNK